MSTQKQPGCNKKASAKKLSCEIKGNGCDGIG